MQERSQRYKSIGEDCSDFNSKQELSMGHEKIENQLLFLAGLNDNSILSPKGKYKQQMQERSRLYKSVGEGFE